ncbi:MAG TPA: sulfotransferase [Thermoguttaceae bacterium]|nr:sulfotransferase [Thermoguttaceae bacterium]
MAAAADKKPGEQGARERFWHMRFWNGMWITGWFRLLGRNRFAVSPSRVGMTLIISMLTLMHLALWAIQKLIYGRRIARTEIEKAPIFVIGHWRSGTTLLHELMVLDRRHTYPDACMCFAPNHFLVSTWFLGGLIRRMMPSKRPMDNMKFDARRPQEDEFAMCNMGVPSPILTIAFANRPPQYPEYLDLRGLPPEALARWKRALMWFLKCITVRDARRIVLKSPPHTARIKTLLEMFPDARFVHIVRDPVTVFVSTVYLWKRLYRRDGLQVPKFEGLDEYVFETFNRMYAALERDRALVEPSRFCEVRYEDLVKDPIGQTRSIYEHLELGEFDQVLPALEQYVADQKDYQTNRYEISDETRAEIRRRWSKFIEQYGYATEPASV